MSENTLDGEIYLPDGEISVPVTYYQTMKILDYKIRRALRIMKEDEKKELLEKHIPKILKERMPENTILDLLSL